jgi:hypothetical protein
MSSGKSINMSEAKLLVEEIKEILEKEASTVRTE